MTRKIVALIFMFAYGAILFGCVGTQDINEDRPGSRPSVDQYMRSNEDENMRETAGRI